MKVAIYAGMYKKNQDGATKTLYELTDSLLKKKIEVGVWAFTVTPQKRKGLHLYEIPSLPLPLYPEYKISLPRKQILKQLDRFKPDVIHITVPDLVGLKMMKYAKSKSIPVVTSYHTDFPSYLASYKLGWFYKLAWRYFKWFYNKSKIVLAPTDEMINKLKSNGISHVKKWNRGIHRQLFNPKLRSSSLRKSWGAHKKKVIMYCGRFVWYKDLRTFINVYKHFKATASQNIKFVLAGDGPIAGQLKKEMPDAIFTNYLSPKKLAEVYASADLLLFPSTTETFGNVVLEAISSGIPAVVSDEGGCQEIVNHSGGGLVAKAKDPENFYQSCKKLLENPFLYNSCKSVGIAYSLGQDWERINDGVIHEYKNATGKKYKYPKKTFMLERKLDTQKNTGSAPAVRSA